MTRPTPSVDLGYSTGAHGRIPSFNTITIEAEAAFWGTHSFTDFEVEFTPFQVMVGKNLSAAVSVRLDPRDRAEIDRQARAKGVGPSTLIRMWVKEHLKQEAEAESSSR